MRLREALKIIAQSVAGSAGQSPREVHLLCGFTPLLLESFVKARVISACPGALVEVLTGLYGDLEGNLQRARARAAEGALVVIEWSDLDPRLGLRSSAAWRSLTLEEIPREMAERGRRLAERLAELAEAMPVVLAPPTLELPPLTCLHPMRAGDFELGIQEALLGFLQKLNRRGGIRLISPLSLASASPQPERHDVRMDLLAGFPYSAAHSDVLAAHLVECLFPAPAKKGLITDLDDTLWKGMLGDVGAEGVSWSLDGQSQAHALYQNLLCSLGDSGVLLAVASKNDPERVEAALRRPDLLLPAAQIFPVEAGWGAKSGAVARILKTWNIGPDSVVFVDDSPMELAEVSESHPGIECLRFPADDPAAIYALLRRLRALFGKEAVLPEDRLRLHSIRAAADLEAERAGPISSDFLSRLEAKITIEGGGSGPRAFELVNKTNQFNLNGRKYREAEWQSRLAQPGWFVATVSYQDRFGPLGLISVIGGELQGSACLIDIWVMSCRAFSRDIEFQTLRQVFRKGGFSSLRFRFKPSGRNGPLQAFLEHFFPEAVPLTEGEPVLTASAFESLCPPLYHQVIDAWSLPEQESLAASGLAGLG